MTVETLMKSTDNDAVGDDLGGVVGCREGVCWWAKEVHCAANRLTGMNEERKQ